MCCRTTTSVYPTSLPGDGLFNGVDRPRHDQVHTELSQLRVRAPRVAVHAVAGLQPIRPDQTRIDGEHQRGVGETGMGSDFLLAVAPTLQQPREFRLARAIILLDGMGVDARRGPFAIEPRRDSLFVSLIAAVIAEKDD